MRFIKLTMPIDNEPAWIDPSQIVAIRKDKLKGTLIDLRGGTFLTVAEAPDEVLALIDLPWGLTLVEETD